MDDDIKRKRKRYFIAEEQGPLEGYRYRTVVRPVTNQRWLVVDNLQYEARLREQLRQLRERGRPS